MTDNSTVQPAAAASDQQSSVEQAHEVVGHVHGAFTIFPGHAPRRNTPEYNATHQKMCVEDDTPCIICRVRHSTLSDPKANWMRATFMETHHFVIQDSLADAVSIEAITQFVNDTTDQQPLAVLLRHLLAGVHDRASLEAFIDSPQNMIVVCDKCHIGIAGIHTTPWNYWIFRAFAIPGWKLFDLDGKQADAAQLVSYDQHLQELEQAAEQASSGSGPAPTVVVVETSPAPPATQTGASQ